MELAFKSKNDKQIEAASYWIDDVTEEILYGGGKGGGKDIALDTLVFTNSGWKKAKEVNKNDLLLTPKGEFTKIKGIFPKANREFYSITFNDGQIIKSDSEHSWLVKSSKHGSRDGWVVKNTKQILSGSWVIPNISSPVPGKEWTGCDPYILGYILGNGTLTAQHQIIYCNEPELVDWFRTQGWSSYRYDYSTCWMLQKSGEEFRSILSRNSGDNKFIPKELLESNPDARLALLQGLMDSDGSIEKDGSASFCTTNENLRDGVIYLVRSLGGRSTWRKVYKETDRGGRGWYYDVSVTYGDKFTPFRLSRKLNRIKKTQKLYNQGIKFIERIENQDGVCFAVEDASHLFVIQDFIVTHNSFLGASLIFGDALIYPETHYFIARGELTDLRKFTIPPIHEVFKNWGVKIDDYATFNGQDNCYTLYNGSKVFLLACKEIPSDPLFERFGSMQMTRGWIEEGGEVAEAAKANLWLSVGRWKNDVYKLKKKLLITANPKKGWMKRDFVDMDAKDLLPKNRKFIKALATDNVYLPLDYIETLRNEKDIVRRQRLFEGNWDYEEDRDSLISFDALTDSFSNTIIKDGNKYLIVDVARLGQDSTVFAFWDGLELYKVEQFHKQDTSVTVQKIKDFASAERIPYSNILIDSDGVGGGVVDQLFGVKGFVANSTPLPTAEQVRMKLSRVANAPATTFFNLKTQCAFKLAELINEHKIAFKTPDYRDQIIEELTSLLRQKNVDSDGKAQLRPKDDVKKELGKSPDIGDTLIYRAFFELHRIASGENPDMANILEKQKAIFISRKNVDRSNK